MITKISNMFRLQSTIVLILLVTASCGTIGILVDGRGGTPTPGPRPGPEPRSYPSYRALKIPPGHLPPPGQCRIWYPGKPPGHQPPPVSCESALRTAGANTWILYRDAEDPKILEVKEKKAEQTKVEVIINHYLID